MTEHPFIINLRQALDSPPYLKNGRLLAVILGQPEAAATSKTQQEKTEEAFSRLANSAYDFQDDDRKVVSDALVELAGRNVRTDTMFKTLFWDILSIDAETIDVATRILKNNQHLCEDEKLLGYLRTNAITATSGNNHESLCKSVAGLLGEVGGKKAVLMLAGFLGWRTAVPESIGALGKIGHEDPETAILALREIKTDPRMASHNLSPVIDQALAKIEASIVNERQTLGYEDLNRALETAKLGWWGSYQIRKAMRLDKGEHITMAGAVQTGMRMIQRGHPIQAKRGGKLLAALNTMKTAP